MKRLFQRSELEKAQPDKSRSDNGARMPRHSSGWVRILSRLKSEPGLRVLDIGPTSPTNINFLTSLGHSVYMADLVEEAIKPEWMLPAQEGEKQAYETQAFLAKHMDFGDRKFHIVLLWDALDYVPQPLGDAILRQLTFCLTENGQALAFCHSKMTGPDTKFCRYHVTDGDMLEMQLATNHPVLRNYQNRQIEALFQELGSCRFLLAKDNIREVIVTR